MQWHTERYTKQRTYYIINLFYRAKHKIQVTEIRDAIAKSDEKRASTR